tara:strand:- start:1367 stop:1564 length:198 start_codon:yes stop_codon:yes gene_type:complete
MKTTETNLLKMFMLLNEVSGLDKENQLKADERMVFATNGIIKPKDWDTLPIEERQKRINKLKLSL